MGKSEEAVEQFRSGANCSQAVLGVYAEQYGIDPESALAIACGFGAGMGRMGHTCGAVTGAIMVIGLAAGEPDPRSFAAKIRVYGLVRTFIERFTALHKTTSCRELLDCDLSTPEGYEDAQGRGLFQTQCPTYVQDAVEILEEMF